MAACRCGCPAVRVFLQSLGSFGDSWPCRQLPGLGWQWGCTWPPKVSLSIFVCHQWAIKIVPSFVCTCSNVLAYGLLSPLFMILLLFTHQFHGVKTDCFMPRKKRDVLMPRPHIAPPFLCPSGCAAPKLVAELNTSRLLRWAVGAVLCQLEEWHLFHIPSGRAALPKWEQGCHLLLVLVVHNLFCLL